MPCERAGEEVIASTFTSAAVRNRPRGACLERPDGSVGAQTLPIAHAQRLDGLGVCERFADQGAVEGVGGEGLNAPRGTPFVVIVVASAVASKSVRSNLVP